MRKVLMVVLTSAVLAGVLAAPVSAADRTRPIWGVTSGVDSYGPPTCPGGVWQYSDVGTGQFSHLGEVTIEESHCTYATSDLMQGTFAPGTLTLTAANGDKLILSDWGAWRIVVTPSGMKSIVHLSWTVVGGTGRFDGATGSGTGAGIGDITRNTTTVVFSGKIKY